MKLIREDVSSSFFCRLFDSRKCLRINLRIILRYVCFDASIFLLVEANNLFFLMFFFILQG